MESKIILFSVNSSICLFLQLLAIRFVMNSFGSHQLRKTPKVRAIYLISLTSFFVLAFFIGLLIYQLIYYQSYETWINIVIVSVSYGMSSVLIIWLALIFFRWYKSNHDRVVFLYFVSMSLIAFNLILAALFVDIKISYAQYTVREFDRDDVRQFIRVVDESLSIGNKPGRTMPLLLAFSCRIRA